MNFIVKLNPNADKGGQKIRKFCGYHIWKFPNKKGKRRSLFWLFSRLEVFCLHESRTRTMHRDYFKSLSPLLTGLVKLQQRFIQPETKWNNVPYMECLGEINDDRIISIVCIISFHNGHHLNFMAYLFTWGILLPFGQ